jgi:hypothetical protein
VKKSYVLKALQILGPEEILKLSQVLAVRTVMKKAAGAELIEWDDAPKKSVRKNHSPEEGKVLEFKKGGGFPKEPIDDPYLEATPLDESEIDIHSTDLLLWQRELSKECGLKSKKDAVQGYRKSTQMYVVKSSGEDGAEKIRFASTNGVLVNKKQT